MAHPAFFLLLAQLVVVAVLLVLVQLPFQMVALAVLVLVQRVILV
jgi:hypothetical protein